VQLVGNASYYIRTQAAYNSAPDGDTVKIQVADLNENLDLYRNISVHLRGGYGCDFILRPGFTTIRGDLLISGGTVTVENIIIK
jgi:hypothetical protein